MPSMEVALVNGERAAPAPGLKGECPLCGKPAQAKCGPIIRWHWAHAGRRHCDPWMENEGPWHRAWKALFPLEWQEVVAFDHSGERHIADVKRPDGTVIELQNSPMSIEEMESRETFYGERMIWIVNGEKFKEHIRIGESLPDPNHERLRDFKLGMPTYTKWSNHFRQPSHDGSGYGYFRRSDIAADKSQGAIFELHHGKAFDGIVAESYRGQHAWSWRNPREGWLMSRRTVVFDMGQGVMWAIAKYGDDEGLCLQQVSLKALLDSLLSGATPTLS
ncbi:competence protein CoiA [Pseudomonas syringae group genomosp. 7]|uniref:competence protein CoiA n=1 Tax=Pseudomonas syringae group genomosp. 7 TaxID=251699 RepID=UPI000F3D193C|nr:competence protein CoiA family protein [Pseudomonas syringae group genomosp. 7]RMR09585.1 hypothetical protein ALP93_101372 [Pseudomonas syringae pv. helianthi]